MSKVFEDLVEKSVKEKILDEKVKLIRNLMETMQGTAEQAIEALKISKIDKKLLMLRL